MTVIVLAYLLVIALAVAVWSAVSLRRVSAPAAERRERAGAAPSERGKRPDSHDAYRGVRAQQRSAEATFADPYLADEDLADGDRVIESRRERERKADARALERVAEGDAFERFLRANEDLDR